MEGAIVAPSAAPDDRAVVAIRYRNGELRCSGTVIAPRVILTAAHCGIHAGNFWDFQVFFGENTAAPGTTIDVVDALAHPDFVAATFANDVALLFLRDIAPAPPVALREQPFAAADVGSALRFVGYGRTGADATDEGTRRQGNAPISEVTDADLTIAGGGSQPCSFDSGGAAFVTIAGVEQLAGVVSRGDSACASYARFARVDAQRAFVQSYLDATKPGTRSLAERCLYDGQCTSGLCLDAPDEPHIRYCSKTCAADAECGALKCLSGRCAWPEPTPGAPGSICKLDADCVGAPCLSAPDGTLRCAPSCSPLKPTCSAKLVCSAVTEVRYACLPPATPPSDDPSCSYSPAGSDAALGALLTAWALRSARRRRRAGA